MKYVKFLFTVLLLNCFEIDGQNSQVSIPSNISNDNAVSDSTATSTNATSDAKQDDSLKDDETFAYRLSKMKIPEKLKLKEIVFGNPDAPKSLIIYFSYTCPHCRDFHRDIYPKFKEKFVDTGKIKVIFRNYIDDQGAYESAQIIRCLCEKQKDGNYENEYSRLTNFILNKQNEWLKSKKPNEFLVKIFTDISYNESDIRACLKRTDIGGGLMLEQQRAMGELHVISMPTFILIGGNTHVGTITFEELIKLCDLK
ncbi:MAG: thioredoxin domain-containing protein [Alphaproteobacteria bacterium]|nr:thioredoxin domain-containing protein [Alphaproteobacteria bacterium]